MMREAHRQSRVKSLWKRGSAREKEPFHRKGFSPSRKPILLRRLLRFESEDLGASAPRLVDDEAEAGGLDRQRDLDEALVVVFGAEDFAPVGFEVEPLDQRDELLCTIGIPADVRRRKRL